MCVIDWVIILIKISVFLLISNIYILNTHSNFSLKSNENYKLYELSLFINSFLNILIYKSVALVKPITHT